MLSSASRQSVAGKSEQHNVLPLHVVSSARFPLLPVISESSRGSGQIPGGTTTSKQVCYRYPSVVVSLSLLLTPNLTQPNVRCNCLKL